MMALRCIVYFAEHEPRKVCGRQRCPCVCLTRSSADTVCLDTCSQFRDIISRQRLGDATQYPFGIAAINVACMLGDLLGIRDAQFNPVKVGGAGLDL
jgi:hypothetical protein